MSLYGNVLLNYSGGKIKQIYAIWRKCIRRLLNISNMPHSRLLPVICDDLPVQFQPPKRFNKFMFSVSNSDNVLVKLCCQLNKSRSMSNVSRSFRTKSNELSCTREVCCECPCKFARLLRNKHR